MSGGWKDEYVDFAKPLWMSGVSGATIARQLNNTYETTFTRNAIISKMDRLKVPFGGGPGSAKCRDKSRSAARSHAARRSAEPVAAAPPKPIVPAFIPTKNFQAPPETRIYRFYDLDIPRPKLNEGAFHKHCRYIYGDPADLFRDGQKASYCGLKAEPGTSWCKEHNAACTQPIVRRAKPAVRQQQLIAFEREKVLT